jgi:hypothetical protein
MYGLSAVIVKQIGAVRNRALPVRLRITRVPPLSLTRVGTAD